ncbi:D-isomer specific 2-hydroxyacid dehydrogenase [Papiliotrema laurentii]|uniref:D-isomer specific 2-hydroxyacid dehydrogenase n=1 Tax=Papiliotrema laurentii TaxID=5418 RepID=A0AAD9CTZ6_PAPLA|nr:D-isomer specific 2-hydroxyacid dehydrogenase [Papiliotrema laurentii]
MPTIEWVRLEPVHIGDPVSTSTLLVAFFIECLFHLSLVMTSQEHSDGAKPRVLLLGRNHADQSVMDELERVADVYILPPVEQPAVSAAIGKMVAQHGPFLAVVILYELIYFPWVFCEEQMGALAPETKLYVLPAAGYDDADVEWIWSTGATFANCPTEVGERTADGTLLLLLATTRGLTTHFLSTREGRWRDHSIKSLNWRTKTLGIIGLGSIGIKVAQMARGLGFRVIYSNRRRSTVTDEFEFVTRQELYAQADVVVLMTPLNDETRHMIDKDAITQMRDGVVIVNTSRGPVINEQDLVDALESGKVLRAGLDVFEKEPEIHPGLKASRNVVITPHVAARTDDLLVTCTNESLYNVIEFIKTGSPLTPVLPH